MSVLRLLPNVAALAVVSGSAVANAAAPFQDALVQPPSIGEPQRGSIAGSLSRLNMGAGDLARGTYALPLPIETPSERGGLLAQIFPSYSAEAGISEWGMGFSTDLAIRRHRVLGEPQYDANDDFTSPWGRLVKSSDGAYYPAGLRQMVRVNAVSGGFEAIDASGTKYTFAASDTVTNALGTYAWMLSKVETLLGDVTYLRWQKNGSGRAFLDSATWGGRGDGTQYEAKLVYEPLAKPFVSYAASAKQLLDQRVQRISIRAKRNGTLTERYAYTLSYTTSPVGPAYYLTGLTRKFASGATEPTQSYEYDFNKERLQTASLVHEPALDKILQESGGALLQPERSTPLDIEQNGLNDLERASDNALIRRTASGFVVEPLSASNSQNPRCRLSPSTLNKPRLLTRMKPGGGEPEVFVTNKATDRANATLLTVCTRAGETLGEVSVNGNWELGPNIRLADLDSDQKPDLIRVYTGGVQVLRNVGGSNGYAFEAEPAQKLAGNLAPIATWIVDVNGDGKPDIMARANAGVMVWYGTGQRRFDPTGKAFRFKTTTGALIGDISTLQLSHGDYNGDGLSDVILSRGRQANVYLNQGDAFIQQVVAGTQNIPFNFGYPVVLDLSGSGNEEVVFVDANKAMVLGLTAPSTGLLRKVDDGKGTVIKIDYSRTKPETGNAQRTSVISGLTIESTGHGTLTETFEYGSPAVHSTARFLLGFEHVSKTSGIRSETATFHNDDEVSGLLLARVERDARTPGLERFTSNGFELTSYKGIPFRRQTDLRTGFQLENGLAFSASRVAFEEYSRPQCVSKTRTETASGVLVKFQSYAKIGGLDDELHCMTETERLIGTHSDETLNFDYSVRIERDNNAQPTRFVQSGPDGELVLQENAYDNFARVQASGSPGRGSQTFTYDALGRLKQSVAADGSVTRVQGFDPLTDAVTSIQRDRGGAAQASFSYTYDALERLHKSWNSFSGSSAALPTQELTYRFATATLPGMISSTLLIDSQNSARKNGAELVAADGESLATALWNGAWLLSDLKRRDRATSTATVHYRAPIGGAAALGAATLHDLYASAQVLDEQAIASFGYTQQQTSVLQSGVTRKQSVTWELRDGQVIERAVQNDVYVREVVRNSDGKIVRQRDESGVEHLYGYDALGRLVEIKTPDGMHRVRFDGYGRPARVERENVGAIEYSYYPGSGLLLDKRFFTKTGQLERTQRTDYDAAGRPIHLEHVRASDIAVRDFWLDYDGIGAGPGGSTRAGQQGLLSRVLGEKYERRMQYDAAGRISSKTVSFDGGWRELETAPQYRADGSISATTIRVCDKSGQVKHETTEHTEVDSFGRISKAFVDNEALYTLNWDAEGRLHKAIFKDGHVLEPLYDAVTRRRRGYRVSGPNVNASVSFDLNARGQVSKETYADAKKTRPVSYAYDPRGLLLKSEDSANTSEYMYTASGLPRWAADRESERTVLRGSSSNVGGTIYNWDALGRVTRRGDANFEYGPSGEIDVARTGTREARYYYDETGQRVLKEVAGKPVRAYFEGGVLTETALITQVSIDGMLVGIIENGFFRFLATNMLGTPFLDDSAELDPATPYGVREYRSDSAEVVDFVRLGYDPDLGTIRMGVRDYDPVLSQFWTADPLYFEDLERCQKSPIEANLFGYARSNPLAFTDPSGREAKPNYGVSLDGGTSFKVPYLYSHEDYHAGGREPAPNSNSLAPKLNTDNFKALTYEYGIIGLTELAHAEFVVFSATLFDNTPKDTEDGFGLSYKMNGPAVEGTLGYALANSGVNIKLLTVALEAKGCWAMICVGGTVEAGLQAGLQMRANVSDKGASVGLNVPLISGTVTVSLRPVTGEHIDRSVQNFWKLEEAVRNSGSPM